MGLGWLFLLLVQEAVGVQVLKHLVQGNGLAAVAEQRVGADVLGVLQQVLDLRGEVVL